jgi:cysteine desulfurase
MLVNIAFIRRLKLPQGIYLDNAATTAPYPGVIEAITSALIDNWGNPSSVHKKGQQAKLLLEHSRAVVADALAVKPEEIYFTSGGTEANNLAIAGVCLTHAHERGNVITSALEHPSVTKAVRNLKREGWHINYIPARHGNFDLDLLNDALNHTTTLISIMSVQNELGYRFPLEQVVLARQKYAEQALLHTDAVQLFGKLPFRPKELGVDLATVCAHKIGGPKGIGALFVKEGVRMFTTSFGGGQERGLRSGTESPLLAAGFAKAVEITFAKQKQTIKHVCKLNQHLRSSLDKAFAKVIINSRFNDSPYILSFTLPGINSKKALRHLSDNNVFISQSSACESNPTKVQPGTWRPKSPLTLQQAGISKRAAASTFRVSFSPDNTLNEIDVLVKLLSKLSKQGE